MGLPAKYAIMSQMSHIPTKLELRSIPRKLLNIVLPPLCHICRIVTTTATDNNDKICTSCTDDMEPMAGPLCRVCGAAFHSISDNNTYEKAEGRLCGECILTPPSFERALSALAYRGPLRTAIHRFKYNGETRLAKVLGALMVTGAPLNVLETNNIDMVMPIPLHRKRLRERGFNQSLLLAGIVARAAGATVDHKSLRRVRHTTPQIELSGKERAMNVRGAFEVSSRVTLKAKTVLIIDDVYTTGSTIGECAKILKKEGARVIALTLARAT